MTSATIEPTDAVAQPARSPVWWVECGVVAVSLLLAATIVEGAYNDTVGVVAITIAVGALSAWIVVQDIKSFTIADGAVVSIAILALAARWAAGDTPLAIGLDCLLTGGVLLAFREIYFRRRGFDGLGLGDVKLAAAGGLLVGAVAFAWALLAASLLAILYVAGTGRIGAPIDRSKRLAFGAVLAPAIWAAWVAQILPVLASFGP